MKAIVLLIVALTFVSLNGRFTAADSVAVDNQDDKLPQKETSNKPLGDFATTQQKSALQHELNNKTCKDVKAFIRNYFARRNSVDLAAAEIIITNSNSCPRAHEFIHKEITKLLTSGQFLQARLVNTTFDADTDPDVPPDCKACENSDCANLNACEDCCDLNYWPSCYECYTAPQVCQECENSNCVKVEECEDCCLLDAKVACYTCDGDV